MEYFREKVKSIKEFYNDQDNQQKISVFTNFVSESFKVVLASLLCVFIPQGCSTEEESHGILSSIFGSSSNQIQQLENQGQILNGTVIDFHVCTLTENFTDLIDFNVFVLAFNFITLTYFIYLYWVELRRESWMIKHLEYNDSKNENEIVYLKDTYPEVIERLNIFNKQYMRAYTILQYIYMINFLVSAVLVLHFYYYDYRTATTLVTNFILLSNKIRVGKKISRESYNKEYAYSFFNTKNLSFNEIDPDYAKMQNKGLLEEMENQNNNDKVSKLVLSVKKYINIF